MEYIFDANGDGVVDAMSVDSNLDGYIDTTGHDQDQNGVFEVLKLDNNVDGITDTWAYDVNQNGVYERMAVDTNGDGQADTSITDSNGDEVPDTVMVDANVNGVDDRIEPSADFVVGPPTNLDPVVNLIYTLVEETGQPVYGPSDSDHDGWTDNLDHWPHDPFRH